MQFNPHIWGIIINISNNWRPIYTQNQDTNDSRWIMLRTEDLSLIPGYIISQGIFTRPCTKPTFMNISIRISPWDISKHLLQQTSWSLHSKLWNYSFQVEQDTKHGFSWRCFRSSFIFSKSTYRESPPHQANRAEYTSWLRCPQKSCIRLITYITPIIWSLVRTKVALICLIKINHLDTLRTSLNNKKQLRKLCFISYMNSFSFRLLPISPSSSHCPTPDHMYIYIYICNKQFNEACYAISNPHFVSMRVALWKFDDEHTMVQSSYQICRNETLGDFRLHEPLISFSKQGLWQ